MSNSTKKENEMMSKVQSDAKSDKLNINLTFCLSFKVANLFKHLNGKTEAQIKFIEIYEKSYIWEFMFDLDPKVTKL